MTEKACKIVIVGASGVGKTALLQQLTDGSFSPQVQSTVGVEFKSWLINDGDGQIKLNIWDTAGQERFRSVAKAYFRGAVGALLVYAVDDEETFSELDSWLNDLHQFATPNMVILLIGNKSDLNDARQVTQSQAVTFSERHGLEYLETSAKSGDNVTEAFVRLSQTITDKVKKGEIPPIPETRADDGPSPVILEQPRQKDNEGAACSC
jgi:small GTP-binding protein